MLALFALPPVAVWGLAEWLTALIAIGGAIAVAYVVFGVLGWQPPSWLIRILCIVAACVVGILAIRFVLSL